MRPIRSNLVAIRGISHSPQLISLLFQHAGPFMEHVLVPLYKSLLTELGIVIKVVSKTASHDARLRWHPREAQAARERAQEITYLITQALKNGKQLPII